jgi:lysozyme family protein
MADIARAITFVLRLEDSTLSGAITKLSGDTGGMTRFGLAIRFHPELIQSGYFSNMDNSDAFTVAVQTYQNVYASRLAIPLLADQRIANSTLSMAVVASPAEAVKLLQGSVGLDAEHIDGLMGPRTITMVNNQPPLALLNMFVMAQIKYFEKLAAEYPADEMFINGWRNRANKALQLVEA